MSNPDTQFKLGNTAAANYSDEEYISMFKEMYEWACDSENEVLSIQELFTKWKLPKATFYFICGKLEECEAYHEMIKDAIIARVNKGAVKGSYSSSPAIFRMKNLGELDEATVNQNHSGSMITEHKVTFHNFKGKK